MTDVVYVIHEQDLDDNDKSVIGVADSLENVDKIMDDYYGEFQTISYQDIRDSSLEWMKVIEPYSHPTKYKVWVEYFQLNKA